MSTLFHTFVRPALVVAVTALMSGASFGAANSSLLSPVVIKPEIFNINELLTVDPVPADATFAGQELLDSIGSYKRTPMVYNVVEFDQDPVAKGVVLLKQLNAKFNTERFVHLNDKWFGFQNDEDPSAMFELDSRTGNLRFNAGLKRYSDEGSTPNLPDEKNIIQFAAKYLIDLGLLPPLTEINTQNIQFGGLNMAVPDDKGGSKIFEKLKTVRAYRMLNGLEVEGKSRLVMHFGEQGALQGIISQWSKVDEGHAVTEGDLIPAVKIREAALANIRKVIAQFEKPELAEVKLVMFDDGQGVIEPAYHFVVNRTFNDKSTREAQQVLIPYDFYLPVLNKSRAVLPDMESARVQPLDGTDEKPVSFGTDE